ncbi:MAG: bifunctional isocitrate dehydrogenase kinase/phosphatase [Acidobacteriota bacterium]
MDNQYITVCAVAIKQAFEDFHQKFKAITSRSATRFEEKDWHGMHSDGAERLALYKSVIDNIVKDVCEQLGKLGQHRTVWANIKKEYYSLVYDRSDCEIAKTFFNSVTRKIFITEGVDPDIEFVDTAFEVHLPGTKEPIYRQYQAEQNTAILIEKLLNDYRFKTPYEDIKLDAKLIAEKINTHIKQAYGTDQITKLETLKPIFYRDKAAYIVGRIFIGTLINPILIALLNTNGGIITDAALLTQDEVSIVFSFTRSYFLVEIEWPRELVEFLKTIMPHKRRAELYISIGYNKHGKSELYQDLLKHLEVSKDRFEIARGDKGMVMIVFTLSSYDVVFKVIKDHFAYPKKTTRESVLQKYNFVFMHDRVGRLVDAQEFEHLRFSKDRFSQELLDELASQAANSVRIDGDTVTIKHLYTERKMFPLNLYIKEMDTALAYEAVLDYGYAIKDLATANIFPGDTLLKNFGVTRHGRVVFYDYDELCLLTECNFREFPESRYPEEELQAEPWFHIAENDIFPSEFRTFLGLSGTLRETFLQAHDDLFGVDFWCKLQKRLHAGEIFDFFPYKQSSRFNRY